MATTKDKFDKIQTKVIEVENSLTVGGVAVTADSLAVADLTASAAELNILDGATLDVGELNILDGVTKTAAQLNAVVIGVAGGYKIARSAAPVSLDGSNPTSFAHGLTTCLSVMVQLVGSAAPADSTSILTAVINGANVDVYAWKHTTGGAAGNPTLVASTGTETFSWIAIGT